MDDIFFEDVVPGNMLEAGPYLVRELEFVEFARMWDPLPIHVGKTFAAKQGGLTAPGIYLLAIKMRLVHTLPIQRSVIASFGYDELRFHRPAHPGDELTLRIEWTSKRPSGSKLDHGAVVGRYSLLNKTGDPIMAHLDTVRCECGPVLKTKYDEEWRNIPQCEYGDPVNFAAERDVFPPWIASSLCENSLRSRVSDLIRGSLIERGRIQARSQLERVGDFF